MFIALSGSRGPRLGVDRFWMTYSVQMTETSCLLTHTMVSQSVRALVFLVNGLKLNLPEYYLCPSTVLSQI